jgi:hypothetical protein
MRDATTLWRAIAAPPRAGLFVALLALVILVAKIAYLATIPEWFERADEYGHLVQDILVATIAAYIFFLFTVQLPAVEEKLLVGPSIAMLADHIAGLAQRFLYQVNFELNAKDGKAALPQPLTLAVVTDLFTRIVPNREPTRVPVYDVTRESVVKLTWIQILIGQNSQCLANIDQLWRYARFLDPELARHLDALRLSAMTRILSTVRDLNANAISRVLNNPDLSVFAEPYFQYYEQAGSLQSYCEQFRNRYGIAAIYPPPLG